MISLRTHSLLPLLLFLLDIRLLPEQYEEVKVFTTDTMLLTATSLMYLCKILFSSSSNARIPSSIPKENRHSIQEKPQRDVLQKAFFATPPCCRHWSTCFERTCFKFRTGTPCRILHYLTEHLKVPGNYG